jgi:hypothetical protein
VSLRLPNGPSLLGTQSTGPVPFTPTPHLTALWLCVVPGSRPSLLTLHSCRYPSAFPSHTQDSSLPKITPAGATLTPDSDLESVKTLSSEAQRPQNNTLPPLGTDR